MDGAVHHLSIDIETYSDVDIKKAGLFRYAQSPAFEILLFAYSLDGGPVKVVDMARGERIPVEIIKLLFDPNCVKHAFNATFEWYCLREHLPLHGLMIPLEQWHCTQLHALYCGYPASLDSVGKAMGLPQDKQKLSTGKALIRYFCVPCAPSKVNGGRTRNLPHHDPSKWELFKQYNAQDVVTEMEIERRLSNFPVPDAVQAQWVTNQLINARGVAADMDLVQGALELDAGAREKLLEEAKRITGTDNPNSVAQLTRWLQKEMEEEEIPNLRKETVKELLGKELASEDARRMLEIRLELGMASNKKYIAFTEVTCADGRARGLLNFYKANRTGRWGGALIQPQNLPRTYIPSDLLPLARSLTAQRNADALELVFGSVVGALSQLIRTAFVAAPGMTFVDADFSAIEARVVAWLAGEEWVLEVFRTHGKIYEATASQLYGVPMEKIKKGNPEYSLRQYGKAATLALGYGGGAQALITAGHLDKETPEEELLDIRNRWRSSNPAIVRAWYETEAAAKEAFRTGRAIPIMGGKVVIARETDWCNDFLTIRLPNGRKLYYPGPHWGMNRFGQEALCYMGQNQKSKNKWASIETWGGTLVENITQAVARDCLAEAIERLMAVGHQVVFHIHDEVVIETPADGADMTLDEVAAIMSQPPSWAPDLPLNAEGWVNPFFKKD